MKWSCERPGRWVGADADGNVASAHKVREGMIHSHEWMWMTYVNGEHITNANDLADAKRIVADHLAAQ